MDELLKPAVEKTARAMLRLGRRTCPRCGNDTLNEGGARNALSRRASVTICDDCGMAEAICDAIGQADNLSDWWISGVIREIGCIIEAE